MYDLELFTHLWRGQILLKFEVEDFLLGVVVHPSSSMDLKKCAHSQLQIRGMTRKDSLVDSDLSL